MATIDEIIIVSEYDASATSAGPMNTEFDRPTLSFGTHKSGIFQQPFFRFDDIVLPSNAIINSAVIEVETVIAGANPGTVSTSIGLLDADGRWDADSVSAQWTDSNSDDDWQVELEDSGPAQLALVGTPAQARDFGPILTGDNGDRIQRAAQGVTITTAGDINIARVSLGGSFTPGAGNVWVEIWSDSSGLPGTILGTSAIRPISDIAPIIWAQIRPTYDFTFSGVDIVAVAANDLVHVVMRTDVAGGGIGIHLGAWRFNYSGGGLSPYGISPVGGFDSQNYLTIDDVWGIPLIGPGVAWAAPVTLGVHTSPDISSLINTWLGGSGYRDLQKIGFRFTVTGGQSTGLAATNHPTGAQPRLLIDFTLPNELQSGTIVMNGVLSSVFVAGGGSARKRGGIRLDTDIGI